MLVYRNATEKEYEDISLICRNSYVNYPLFNIIKPYLKKNIDFNQFLHAFQKIFVKLHIKNNTCHIAILDGKIVSVAILENPLEHKLTLRDYLFSDALNILKYVNVSVILSYMNFLKETSQICDELPEQHWHLSNLVIDTNYQGQAFGSRTIQEFILPFVKSHSGKLLTLTTNTELNRTFYLKNGFVEINKKKIDWKDSHVTNWSFSKEIL